MPFGNRKMYFRVSFSVQYCHQESFTYRLVKLRRERIVNLQSGDGPRIHSKSMHGCQKIHGYQHGYPSFLDVSLQLSIQAWISALISKHGYPCKYISQWISVSNKYSLMDIHVFWISVFNYLCFYGYPFGYPWIYIDIHALTCYGFSIQGIYSRSGIVKLYFKKMSTLHP